MIANQSTASQKQWLVRKVGNGIVILGPYWTDQVRLMVEHSMLAADDEICAENGYWFCIRDVQEVRTQLGLANVPVVRGSTEESTEPDLIIEDVTTDTDLDRTGMLKVKRSDARTKRPDPVAPVSPTELATRFRRVSQSYYLGFGNGRNSTHVLGIEKGRFWAAVFFASIGLAVIGFIWVLKSLKV